jgi:hypothetical protein
VSAAARTQRKQKDTRGRPQKWKGPPLQGHEEGTDQPQQRMRQGHSDSHKVGHYEGPLREVIDSAREALFVYLLTEDPFPMDEAPRNDQLASETTKRAIKWKKMIDGFFNAALQKNEDALALGKLLLDLIHTPLSTQRSDPQDHECHPFCSM